MGFVKGRRESEPKDVALVAAKVAEVLAIDIDTVRKVTTENAKLFFNIY
jgi:Tat protein secretion system quality control protein TatD with DNase activity